MKRIILYLQDSYNELVNKVSWPTWSELQSSALIVMFSSLLFAIVIFAMDIVFEKLMDTVYRIF